MISGDLLTAPPSLKALCMAGPVALFLDFDGTLVELAPGPDDIEPAPSLSSRLAALAERLAGRCALVSGRSIADIEGHIGPLQLGAAGSHGSDIRTADGSFLGEGAVPLPPAVEAALREFADEEQLYFESKPHGAALHYRSDPSKGPRAHAFADDLARQHGLKAQAGKCVIELVARNASKGEAVRTLMQTAPFAGSRPFFLGDDLTDEAGMKACCELGGGGILVGDERETIAQYRLPSVQFVHHWLEL